MVDGLVFILVVVVLLLLWCAWRLWVLPRPAQTYIKFVPINDNKVIVQVGNYDGGLYLNAPEQFVVDGHTITSQPCSNIIGITQQNKTLAQGQSLTFVKNGVTYPGIPLADGVVLSELSFKYPPRNDMGHWL